MSANFSDNQFRQISLSKKTANYENDISAADAFQIVLNGLDYETINILCTEIANRVDMNSSIIYSIIQNQTGDDEFKNDVLNTAYELIHANKTLGTKVVNGKYNASAWIAHSLYEGELAATLARTTGLDADTAMKLGLLHDIGRKFNHSAKHTILGFEYLVELGMVDEAFCALTHSFVSSPKNGIYKGNRCANCDSALEGFYIDENGNEAFKEGSPIDDIKNFLENYEYNSYDMILNIADLMAMSTGIVSPYVRIQDVYTRKTPDSRNSSYFKVCFINALNRLMYNITQEEEYHQVLNINDISSLEKLEELLIEISTNFMNKYLETKEYKEKKYYN